MSRSSAAAVVEIIRRPREFTATLRVGDAVQEKAAGPREDVELEQVTLWFSDTEVGSENREHIRRNLTAGRLVTSTATPTSASTPDPARPLPPRADPDGILRNGETYLGLSDPLALRIRLRHDGDSTPTAELPLYRIPSQPGYTVSYGGTFHGALVFLDINPNAPRPDGQPGRWSDTSIAIGRNASGVRRPSSSRTSVSR